MSSKYNTIHWICHGIGRNLIHGVKWRELKKVLIIVVVLNLLPVIYLSTSETPLRYGVRVGHVDLRTEQVNDSKDEALRKTLTKAPTKPSDTKLILFSDFPDYYKLFETQGPDDWAKCNKRTFDGQEMKCQITVDNRRFQQADAVIFYSHHKTSLDHLGFTPDKRPGTTWTFFAVESPDNAVQTLFDKSVFHGKFNSTMTYREDSEYFHGYIRAYPREVPANFAYRTEQDTVLRNAFRNKTKLAAAFISNCRAPSLRLRYIRQLKKYMDVDVYGRCGKLVCTDHAACDEMLRRDYKFYLAFENSHCRDYVTEKLLRVMAMGQVVPVVRGGADYDKLFPQNSVVNTARFVSPSHLSRYLKGLAKDEDAWVKMLQWSYEWKVKGPEMPLCEYCHSLYSEKQFTAHYDNVHDWWAKNACYPIKDL